MLNVIRTGAKSVGLKTIAVDFLNVFAPSVTTQIRRCAHQKNGGAFQENRYVFQENAGALQENRYVPQKNGGAFQENRYVFQENAGALQENRYVFQENGDVFQENGDVFQENGDAPQENGDDVLFNRSVLQKAFQDNVKKGEKCTNIALIITVGLEWLADLKDHNPEAGIKGIKCVKELIEYCLPKTKLLLDPIGNMYDFKKSVNETMSKKEISNEDREKALLQAVKNFVISTAKLFFSNIGTLIDATTIPKRLFEASRKLGAEEACKNYSQTDIDADGQINYGVPGSESNKDDVDKQNTVSDTKKQEQKSDSDQSEQVKATDPVTKKQEQKSDSDQSEQVKATDPVTKKQEQKSDSDQSEQVKVNICKTIRNDFKQAEGFQVNEERGSYELQEMYNDLTLPEIEERIKKSLSCLLEAEKEHKGIFPTYSQINVDIDGHEILGIWEA